MLLDTINQDRNEARKMKYTQTATLLTTLYSEAQMVGKNDGNRETTDAEVVAVIKKFLKNLDETMSNLPESDPRFDAAKIEHDTLVHYLPAQLTEQELRDVIEDLIQTNDVQSMKDMGFVMTELKAEYDGQYDGKTASQIVRELLK
jgi:uncharacterized protein YqeY